ncbi:hypothetical protein [Streptomyces sp. NPDC048361]|uniref:hypothetical protein n=1 Tax=Streptomyces sp. NPDC048361 TaxID=3154720 RepID=UPI0034129992
MAQDARVRRVVGQFQVRRPRHDVVVIGEGRVPLGELFVTAWICPMTSSVTFAKAAFRTDCCSTPTVARSPSSWATLDESRPRVSHGAASLVPVPLLTVAYAAPSAEKTMAKDAPITPKNGPYTGEHSLPVNFVSLLWDMIGVSVPRGTIPPLTGEPDMARTALRAGKYRPAISR